MDVLLLSQPQAGNPRNPKVLKSRIPQHPWINKISQISFQAVFGVDIYVINKQVFRNWLIVLRWTVAWTFPLITFSQIISFLFFQAVTYFFFIVDLVVSFVKWDGEDMRISTVTGIILDADPTLFEWELSVRFTWEFELWSMLTGWLFLRIVIPWWDLFFLEEATISIGINIPWRDFFFHSQSRFLVYQ